MDQVAFLLIAPCDARLELSRKPPPVQHDRAEALVGDRSVQLPAQPVHHLPTPPQQLDGGHAMREIRVAGHGR
ncbi:hypothetical protein D3C87_1874020 [compost metagenome]